MTGGFELHKWASNNESLLDDISTNSETTVLHLDKEETVKALEILWNSTRDAFSFSIPQFDIKRRIIKTTMFLDVSQIFDPLDFTNPTLFEFCKLQIPRLVIYKNSKRVELHGFYDASESLTLTVKI